MKVLLDPLGPVMKASYLPYGSLHIGSTHQYMQSVEVVRLFDLCHLYRDTFTKESTEYPGRDPSKNG